MRYMVCYFAILFGSAMVSAPTSAAVPDPINIWPETPPGETVKLDPEGDLTKDTDHKVAGQRVVRLGNVSTPTITVYRPETARDTGASVLICPGGGHHILAMDLEGTEVAEWLNTIGVTGIVLKYRVPSRDPNRRWYAAVQDAQRAMSLVRSKASEWKLDPERIGILGFSAGGETAGLTACFSDQRQYEPVDDVDKQSPRPDFAVLVYPAYLVQKDNQSLQPHISVSSKTPPMFFAHAQDDPIHPANSLQLALALKTVNVPAEVHLYSQGGHGFGLRKTDDPCTSWPERCAEWLTAMKVVPISAATADK